MSQKFYLSHHGEQVGPFSLEQIVEKVQSKELHWSDYLFDEKSRQWVLIMEHPEIGPRFKNWFPNGQNLELSSGQSNEAELPLGNDRAWFVLRGDNKYGPFTYVDIIKMLQDKNVYEYDFVWNASLPQWKRIAELSEFHPEKIRTLQSSGHEDLKDAFFRRRYVRAAYNASLVVHNSKNVWKGGALEISAGGAGIYVESAEFEPGQTLFLHFKAGDGVPPFNAICAVVNRQFVDGPKKWIRYGVKFTSISYKVQKEIREYADRTVAKVA